jgi:hypothetical protein
MFDMIFGCVYIELYISHSFISQCIQNKAWNRCLQLLGHPEHAAQAAVWVVRKELNGKLRWRLLPLHAALIFQAPFNVIEVLLEAYPEAAAAKDDQGMLPLHLALRNRPIQWATVEELLTAHPAGVYIQDRKGRTPLQGAASATNGSRIDDSTTLATGSTPDETNNCAALSVLQLYTQIAVAGERRRLESPPSSGPEGESFKMQQLEEKHAETLKQFRGLLQKEKHKWKTQLESMKQEASTQTQQAQAKEEILLKEIEKLQQQVHSLSSSPLNNDAAVAAKLCSRCTDATTPSSPTLQDLRVLEVEQENAILKECLEDLLNQHESLQDNMQTLQANLQVAQDVQNQHLQSLQQSLQESHASRQAHVAIWKSQLKQATKSAADKLAQVGLTNMSSDDEDYERSCLEQVEIDHDNEEQQESSSVVVVRVPKSFLQAAGSPDPANVDQVSGETLTDVAVLEPVGPLLVCASSEDYHESRQDSELNQTKNRCAPSPMVVARAKPIKEGPPLPEGFRSSTGRFVD